MTQGSPVHGVRVLGEGVPYLDGAEDSLLQIVNDAPDRSSNSDDLAASITDWPTRYHLSRLRSNLLLPLRIDANTRVLDVGCGTGVLSRAMAERGAAVTGLEGSLSRAAVAAARTAGLPNCEIVSGSLNEYNAEGHDAEFDVVLLCGVLEYSGSALGGRGGPEQMLAEVRQLLRPEGVVAIAIENQLGLKYLLGYPEDHRGLPWIGIDGYRSGRNPAQTWSRAALSGLLAGNGLPAQEWLYPFPDYKLPTSVVRHRLYESSEGRDLLRLFLRNPVVDYSGGSLLTADATSAFQTMLDAGIGPDTANSFLVVAGGSDSDPLGALHDGDLWLSSGERSAELMDRRVLTSHDGGWRLRELSARREVHLPPLASVRTDLPVVIGANLEDEIVALASRAQGPRELQPLLQEWWAAARPWVTPEPVDRGSHFDVMPRNFIRSDDGALHYVDQEWVWTEEVPQSWALLRSMWYLVFTRLWPAGALAGMSWHLTLSEATLALAQLVDPRLDGDDLEAATGLEAILQSRVGNSTAEQEQTALQSLLDRRLLNLSARPSLAQIVERPAITEESAQSRVVQAQRSELAARDELAGCRAELESTQVRLREADRRLSIITSRPLLLKMAQTGLRVKRKLQL